MVIKEAVIYLDNQWNIYLPGQVVNGRIEYVFEGPILVRGIHVKIKGEAHIQWFVRKQEQFWRGNNLSTGTFYTGNEEYFQISYYLIESKTGNEIEIPSGKQVYNFTCTLPSLLPSSFEGQFGYIRYTVKVTLERPWKFNHETKMTFTVMNDLDLNLNTSYKEPIHFQIEKTFCCFCCTSPPLSIDVRAPVSGYAPGQRIPFTIDVENESNVELHLVKIFLRKVVNYRSTTPNNSTKKTKEIILTVQEGPAPKGTIIHWTLFMEIPQIPPSNLVNCNIIDLDYDLEVECVIPGAHSNIKDQKYIIIGTVPLINAGLSLPFDS